MVPTKVYKLEHERSENDYVRPKDRFKFNILIIVFMVSIGLTSFMIQTTFSTQKILQTTGKSEKDFRPLKQENISKFPSEKILIEQKILDEIENRISKMERQAHNLRIVMRNTHLKTAYKKKCRKYLCR